MKVKLKLEVSFPSEEFAEAAKNALDPENYVYLTCVREKKVLKFFGEYERIGSLMHTLEDLNSCLSMLFQVFSQFFRKSFSALPI